MLSLFAAVNGAVHRVLEQGVADERWRIDRAVEDLRGWSDRKLQERCRDAYYRTRPTWDDPVAPGPGRNSLLTRLTGRRLDEFLVGNLALGVAAFRRAPADLKRNAGGEAKLRPGQVTAAIALCQRYLVQMDTGEGKTYALLPAAFALACRYRQVYIVCANPYLAARDAQRTRPFWEYVGLAPGLAVEKRAAERGVPAQWGSPVVYTTLRALAFKSLEDELSPVPVADPISSNRAVLLDEADSILLDQAHGQFILTTEVEGAAVDWKRALEYSRGLVEGEDIQVDRARANAVLTQEGAARLRARVKAAGAADRGRYEDLRAAVEAAFVAQHVVQRDRDYVVDDGRVVFYDAVLGAPDPGARPSWLGPLEQHLGLPVRPISERVHQCSALGLLLEFQHLAGTSGTVVDDALEYLQLGMGTVRIPPHHPRRETRRPQLLLPSREEAVQALAERVVHEAGAGRPVLVGTQNVGDATACRAALDGRLPDTARLQLFAPGAPNDGFSAQTDDVRARMIVQAGQPGSVLVITQFAGRGVDIRPAPEVDQSGGMAVLCLAHAEERRHDRQLLGRAGRQGARFTAQFVNYQGDPLLRYTPRAFQQNAWVDEGSTPFVQNALGRIVDQAQRRLHWLNYLRRGSGIAALGANADAARSFRGWLSDARSASEAEGDGELPEVFRSRLLREFCQRVARGALADRDRSHQQAHTAALRMNVALGYAEGEGPIVASFLVGEDVEVALQRVQERLDGRLDEAFAANAKRRAELDPNPWGELLARMAAGAAERTLERIDAATVRLGDLEKGAVDAVLVERLWDVVRAAKDLLTQDGDEGEDGDDGEGGSGSKEEGESRDGRGHREYGATQVADPAAVVAEVPALRVALAECRREAIERLDRKREALDRAIATRRYARRTPRATAFWSCRRRWTDFLIERDRIQHRLRQLDLPLMAHYRQLGEEVATAWRRTEELLPAQVLGHLLRCGDPTSLDDLFRLADFEVPDEELAPVAPRSAEERTAPSHPTQVNAARLVDEFVRSVRDELTEELSSAQLRKLLTKFLDLRPLPSLQLPEHIAEALERLDEWETLDQVDPKQRAARMRWLRRFLEWLHQNGLIGSLPTRRTAIRGRLALVSSNLRDWRISVPLVAAALIAAGLAAVAAVRLGPAQRLHPFAGYVDDLVAGGLLNDRSLAGPGVAALVVAVAAVTLLQPARGGEAMGAGPELWLGILLAFALGVWTVPWSIAGPLALLGSVALLAAVVLVARVLQLACWTLRNQTGIALESAWLCYAVAVVFIPATIDPAGRPALAALAAVALTALFVFRRRFVEVSTVASYVVDPSTAKAELVPVPVRVRVSCGIAAHAAGILAAWTLSGPLGRAAGAVGAGAWRELVPLAAYVAVVVASSWLLLAGQLEPRVWWRRLHDRRQELPNVASFEDLARYLDALRSRWFWREAAFQSAVVAATATLLWQVRLPGTRFPLTPALVLGAVVLAEHARAFRDQIGGFLLSRGGSRPAVPEPVEAAGGGVLRRLWPRARRIAVAAWMAWGGILWLDSTTSVLQKLDRLADRLLH